MTTIQILVAGLVALVPGGGGEMTLLLPKVETMDYCRNFDAVSGCCVDPEGRHIPVHHAFLGYEKEYGRWSGKRGTPVCGGDGDALCWIKLESAVVAVVNGRSGSVDDDLEGRITFLRTMPTSLENLAGFSWVGEMDRVTVFESDGAVSALCRGPGIGLCPVRGRVTFQYNRRRACRLSDSKGGAGTATVHEFVFKKRESDVTMAPPTQALAVASLFELESASQTAYVEVNSPDYQGRLEVPRDSNRRARLIFTQFIPNTSADQYEGWYNEKCMSGRDSHFVTYYRLLHTGPGTPMLPFVKSTKELNSDWIKEACQFPHLEMPGDGRKDLFAQNLIPPVSPIATVPEGYEKALDLAGPPLCPQAVFKPPR